MEGALQLGIAPTRSYIERVGGRQLLNVDLELRSGADRPYRLTAIELDVRDGDRLVLRRIVDGHGLRAPIESIPMRDLEPGGALCVFNPFHTFGADLALVRLRFRCRLEGADGSAVAVEDEIAPVRYQQLAELRLPLRGGVFVAAGHDFLSPHRRVDRFHPAAAAVGLTSNSARYADDLSIAADDGSLFERDGRAPSDWHGYGEAVYAPADGRVATALGDVPDGIDEQGRAVGVDHETPLAAVFGNQLIIDHGGDEFSVLGHLLRGSVTHRAGDEVRRGERVGAIGFSGDTDFAHLHYQLQDGPNPANAEGLPASFTEAGSARPLEPGAFLSLR
jgi:hypothetical protein